MGGLLWENVILDGIYSELRKMNSKDVRVGELEPYKNDAVEMYEKELCAIKNKYKIIAQDKNVNKDEVYDLYNEMESFIDTIMSDGRVTSNDRRRFINSIVSLRRVAQTELNNIDRYI